MGKRNRQRQRDKNWRKQPQESLRDFALRRGNMALGRQNGLSESSDLRGFAFPFKADPESVKFDLPDDIKLPTLYEARRHGQQ